MAFRFKGTWQSRNAWGSFMTSRRTCLLLVSTCSQLHLIRVHVYQVCDVSIVHEPAKVSKERRTTVNMLDKYLARPCPYKESSVLGHFNVAVTSYTSSLEHMACLLQYSTGPSVTSYKYAVCSSMQNVTIARVRSCARASDS